ncbi:sensor histidine kinase [Haloplanus sp. GCM10025708]|uniref:sensor histidine kinase n=1 Tax=Haloplanus sp. GCM10025708 TaxID=3252679 RepID=UPI00360D4F92
MVYTNLQWREFARENDLVGDPSTLGENYLDVCDAAADAGDEDAREIAAGLRDLLAGDEESFSFEYPCHSPTQRRWFLMYAATYAVGGERYVQVSHLDVTDRKESELAVERRNERLRTVASVLSHDLRNPLTVAQGYLDALSNRVDGAEMEHIRTALTRMNDIISDALILARESEPEALEVVTLRDAAERAWEHVETRGAALEVTGSVAFEADRSLLGNLFENLFRNAVEHGSTSSRDAPDERGATRGQNAAAPADTVEYEVDVTVRVGPLDDAPGFFVEDDGPGVPEDVRESVFESGFTTRSEGGSTGLGLTIVSAVAERHGWTVDLTESADGGARFEVRA